MKNLKRAQPELEALPNLLACKNYSDSIELWILAGDGSRANLQQHSL
jgi:hypothetical protein